MFLALYTALLTPQTTVITLKAPPIDHRGEVDQSIAVRFDPVWERCTAGVLSHKNDADTANSCKAAAIVADEFKPRTRGIERRMAYVYAATSFANIGDWKAALPYADRAVSVISEMKEGGSGAESAYETRAQIKAFSGDLAAADQDAERADEYAREMVKGGLSTNQLRKDLEFHSELLKRLGCTSEAKAKEAEAAKL